MTPTFRYTLLWLAGSTLVVIAALTLLTAAHADGEFLPSNADAFYHARRILDSLFSGEPVIQFDTHIHVPEGSWVTWPWGYDTLMTFITRMFGPFSSEADANRVLMNIPPAAAPIAVGLVVIIARQLALPFLFATLLVMGFSALPLVYMQFAVGNIDHHFAELLWTLGAMSAGIRWFGTGRNSVGAGITLGCVLGSGLAIHNGLFILQIPIAATLALFWIRGLPLPERRSVVSFGAALLLMTLLVCIPSEPWRRGFFEFYTLSWFHFYIAACVAVFALLLTTLRFNTRNLVILLLAAAVALVPVLGTLSLAGEFVSGQLESIRNIVEAKSPYELYRSMGEEMSTRFFSWLMWLSLPMLLLSLWWVYRLRDPAMQFVAISSAMGLAILQLQFRFSVFGELPMLLMPLLAARMLSEWKPAFRQPVLAGSVLLFAICFWPTIANWQLRWSLGGNLAYGNIRSTFPELKKLCDERPGIVLGDLDTGHWVRYHSQCSVIADVFLLTPQHAAKAFESARLMHLTPAELLAGNNEVRYVLAHHTITLVRDANAKETPDLNEMRKLLSPLERDLLAPTPMLPPQFKKRWEVLTPAGQVFSRLYEIDRGP
ncbi:MAG: hypothetical protein ABI821_02230 [Pseudomonadota bacterium]